MTNRSLSILALSIPSLVSLNAQEPTPLSEEERVMNEEVKFREVRCLKTNKAIRIPCEQVQQTFDSIGINTPRNLQPGEQFSVTFRIPEIQLDEVELKYEISSSSGIRVIEGPKPLKPLFRKGDAPTLTSLIQKIAPGHQALGIFVVFYHRGKIVGYGSSGVQVNEHEAEPVEPTIRDEAWEKRKDKVIKEGKARELPQQPIIRN
jgi:hypothetical protein